MSSRFAVAVVLIPGMLSAQSPDTTAVPRDLVRALLAFAYYTSSPQIVVGRLPDERLTAIVPRGARVLGGVNYQEQRNPRTLTILSMSESPDSALVLVAKALEGVNYKPAPAFESARGERGGFVSTAIIGPTMPGSAITYCTDGASMYVSIMEGENRDSMIRLMSSSVRNTMCDSSMRARMRGGRSMEEIELPTLRPPPGAIGGTYGMSSSGDSRESTARLQSGLSAAEMIDHFAPQLREQGWTLGSRATDGDLSVVTARRTDKNGEPLHLALTNVRYGARDHDVTLRVWMQSRPR